jgi:hypothetical protein
VGLENLPVVQRSVHLFRRVVGVPRTVLGDDTFIVSFPRSGNTWTQFLLTNLLCDGPADFRVLEHFVPDVHQRTDAELLAARRPRIIKSHAPYDRRYPRVIYLVRDGRDVAVSYYHRRRDRGFNYGDFSGYLRAFVAGRVGLIGGWREHVLGWRRHAGRLPFLLVRYEDQRRDPTTSLAAMAGFLGLDATPDAVERAVAASDFCAMQRIEQGVRPASAMDRDRAWVRRGEVGGWRAHFSAADRTLFDAYAGDLLEELGYERA